MDDLQTRRRWGLYSGDKLLDLVDQKEEDNSKVVVAFRRQWLTWVDKKEDNFRW